MRVPKGGFIGPLPRGQRDSFGGIVVTDDSVGEIIVVFGQRDGIGPAAFVASLSYSLFRPRQKDG